MLAQVLIAEADAFVAQWKDLNAARAEGVLLIGCRPEIIRSAASSPAECQRRWVPRPLGAYARRHRSDMTDHAGEVEHRNEHRNRGCTDSKRDHRNRLLPFERRCYHLT
jgi:hypothetical protein